MSRLVKILFWGSLLLFALSVATCQLGVSHEVNQIPTDVREKMQDTDWVGVKWIWLGSGILLLSIFLMIAAAFTFWRQKKS